MKKVLIFFFLATLFLTGCSISFGGTKTPTVSGVFKSSDKGDNWVPKHLYLYSGGAGNISKTNVLNLTFDPQDNRAIYLSAASDGLLYSYDSANSWRRAEQIGDARIESVVVDPKNKCVIYATDNNTIVKSVDCNRSWTEIYIGTPSDRKITALAVDFFNNLTVYAGNSGGDLLKSSNGGGDWRVINRFSAAITKILIDPNDTRIIYVATKNKGIFKTITAGSDWFGINDGLNPYSGSMEYRNLIFDDSLPDALLLVAKYGLLKTIDGGITWEPITLITPPASIDIYAVAINPQNNKEIYYATATTFYKTVDGGVNWITRRLPSGAVATSLLIDPINPNILYMGLTAPKR